MALGFQKIYWTKMQPLFTTKGEQGTGLGLAISREIIEVEHMGSFRLSNSSDGGLLSALFYLSGLRRLAVGFEYNMPILVVDDDAMVRDILVEYQKLWICSYYQGQFPGFKLRGGNRLVLSDWEMPSDRWTY